MSRFVGLVIVKLTFLVALLALPGLLTPAVGGWIDAHALGFGLAIPALLLASYLLAIRLADGRGPRPAG